ncbi:MAG: hypothetical protein PHW20_05450 [Clostridia bacterium]|nr:hypothetical protein [Clostridia bacterium]
MKAKTNRTAIIATVVILAAIIGLGLASYYISTSYVSMDINPSVEYSINMYDRVIDAKGVNEDGIRLLEEINIEELKNKSIDDALSMTIEEAVQEGYLEEEGAGVMISTEARNSNNASELAARLQESVKETVTKNNPNAEIVGEAVGLARVEEAHELGVTPGKLNLVEKLINSSDDPQSINKEEWLNKSVKEIMAKTNENKETNMDREQNMAEDEMNQEQNMHQEENIPSDVPGQASPQNDSAGQGSSSTQTPAQNSPSETPGQGSSNTQTPGNSQGGTGQN